MITLPDNFIDMALVDVEHKRLIIHVKNEANQYYTEIRHLDPAIPLEAHLTALRESGRTTVKAYRIAPATMETIHVEPDDNHWVPAPVPGDQLISLAQYKALQGLPDAA